MKKLFTIFLSLIIACACLFGCGVSSGSSTSPSGSTGGFSTADGSNSSSGGEAERPVKATVYPVEYGEVKTRNDMDGFYAETLDQAGRNTVSHDGKLDYGFVKSVWHEITVNGVKVPVYSARCGNGIHSFAWADLGAKGDFIAEVSVKYKGGDKKSSVIVLPEKSKVRATLNANEATAVIDDFGSYTFVYDESPEQAVTLYLAPESKPQTPNGYQTVTFEAGTYAAEQTALKEANTFYLFKSGVYDITSISVPANSIVYFERGCYLRVYEDGEGDHLSAFSASGENSKILGRAIVDFSNVTGGEAKTKGAYSFYNVKNFEVEGLISINSNNWTMCTTLGDGVKISRCMFFSYRTFSDGIMFSDCKNSIATDCFIRTGDDAAEVKAFSQSAADDCYTENVVFENNCVWTDKGIAYGCIYESRHDVKGVIFRNNSVGFAQASWSEHLGCLTMQMGSDKNAVWENVRFENTEIYQTSCATVSVYNNAKTEAEGGTIRKIYVNGVTVKKAVQTNLPVYFLSVVMLTGDGVTPSNVKVGAVYIDNAEYLNTQIEADNYLDYSNFNIGEGIIFSKNNIKIGTQGE